MTYLSNINFATQPREALQVAIGMVIANQTANIKRRVQDLSAMAQSTSGSELDIMSRATQVKRMKKDLSAEIDLLENIFKGRTAVDKNVLSQLLKKVQSQYDATTKEFIAKALAHLDQRRAQFEVTEEFSNRELSTLNDLERLLHKDDQVQALNKNVEKLKDLKKELADAEKDLDRLEDDEEKERAKAADRIQKARADAEDDIKEERDEIRSLESKAAKERAKIRSGTSAKDRAKFEKNAREYEERASKRPANIAKIEKNLAERIAKFEQGILKDEAKQDALRSKIASLKEQIHAMTMPAAPVAPVVVEPVVAAPVVADPAPVVAEPVAAPAEPVVAAPVVADPAPVVAEPVAAPAEPVVVAPVVADPAPVVAEPVAAPAEPVSAPAPAETAPVEPVVVAPVVADPAPVVAEPVAAPVEPVAAPAPAETAPAAN